MTVFLDTNVLLDHALHRQDTFALEAAQLLEHCESGQLTGLVSTGSWYSLTYVLRKRWGTQPSCAKNFWFTTPTLPVISPSDFMKIWLLNQ